MRKQLPVKGSLLLLGGLAFGVCLLALTAQRPAHALVSGVLSPSAQGLDSNWTPVNAADEVSSVNQTSCSGSDGNWIVGGNPYKSSFQLPLSSLPSGALVTSVDLTLCYGDDNASADGFETIIPFVRMAGGEYKGSALHSPGNMTPLSNTQTINIPSSGVLEVGVQDTGFLAQSRLRVYAILGGHPLFAAAGGVGFDIDRRRDIPLSTRRTVRLGNRRDSEPARDRRDCFDRGV